MKDRGKSETVNEIEARISKRIAIQDAHRDLDEAYKEYITTRASEDADAFKKTFGGFLMRLDPESMDELWDVFNPEKWKEDANYKEMVRGSASMASMASMSSMSTYATGFNNLENLVPLSEKLNWSVVTEFFQINEEMGFFSSSDEFSDAFLSTFESAFLARSALIEAMAEKEQRKTFIIIGVFVVVAIILAVVN